MATVWRFLFLMTLALPISTSAQIFQELQTAAAVDLLYPIFLDGNQTNQNRLMVRSAEFSFFGAIDHRFDGVLTFAGHTEHGVFVFETHEVYVGSSKIVPRSRFRLGKFLLGVGRLNPLHQHDWPFVSAPKVQQEFFNPGRNEIEAEGAADTGGEFSTLLPLPFYLDLTVGVTDGYCFGHCHGAGHRPPRPLVYFRPVTFIEFEHGGGVQIGLNYLTRQDQTADETVLTGLDATYKLRDGKILKWFVQGEFWHRAENPKEGRATSTFGSYIFTQFGWSSEFYLGLRLDGYAELNRSFNTTGDRQSDFDYAVVPTFTYKSSEFSSLRFAYTHEVDTTEGDSDIRDRRFELQFIYVLGAHPAHDF